MVSCHDKPLLGLSACEHLGLLNRVAPLCIDTETSEPILEGGAIPDTKIFSDPVASQYQEVFEGLGFLRSYPYKIALKADATPHAVVTPRRIPLPYHQKVNDELKRMQSLGVFEEVTQPTEWVSPMVVVPKQSGDVRICVDYVHLNRSVKREHYQLPTAEELFAKMQGAKFFTSRDATSGFLANSTCRREFRVNNVPDALWPISFHPSTIRPEFRLRGVSPGDAYHTRGD